jgi:hypothetical protein
MRTAVPVVIALLALPAAPAHAIEREPIRIELNSANAAEKGCRLSFVIENRADAGLDSLKLDLVVFGRDGVINNRLIAEMGPLQAAKTIVKIFEVAEACTGIGSILLNDVTACAPDGAEKCLARLVLASRVSDIRLFK